MSDTELNRLSVTGYVAEWSVRAGDSISLHVSSELPTYEVSLVRLRHGDPNPEGPGFLMESVPSDVDGTYPGRVQSIEVGSCVIGDQQIPSESWSLGVWVWPTTPSIGREQVIAGWRDEVEDDGFTVVVLERGEIAIRIGDGYRRSELHRTGLNLRRREWFYVVVVVDSGKAAVHVVPRDPLPGDPLSVVIGFEIGAFASKAPFVVAACAREDAYTAHFNGKVEQPTVWNRPLLPAEISAARDGRVADGAVLSWDFGIDQAGVIAHDTSGNKSQGRIRNAPTRAVTGWRWRGVTDRFVDRPQDYAAIWFHDDDLDDVAWEPALTFRVPDELASGIYAFQLRTAAERLNEDFVPFVVTPIEPDSTAVAFLVPTMTYLAYANEHMWSRPKRLATLGLSLPEFLRSGSEYERAAFQYIMDHRLHSIYDDHSDGSGVAYSSRRRPVMNLRPRYGKPALRFRFPHGLSCDLYIIDWLISLGINFVCITDDDLHREGSSLIAEYRAVMTGTHPEYWTLSMLDALDSWLDDGGRLMYMGGNGFYWSTSIDPNRPWLLEQRRGMTGSRAWTSEPGEEFHSTTGEPGGLWRNRGRPPQARLGVGFSAQGGDGRAQPYRRTDASYDPRVAFMFDGVHEELIGDFGLHMGGAAGWELDRADRDVGTPPHALIVASSFGHSGAYHHAIEEELSSGGATAGPANAHVRADLTYFEGPNGGAVFSTGSISWAGSLSHGGYSNAVSRITANVLRRFLDAEPIAPPPPGAYF